MTNSHIVALSHATRVGALVLVALAARAGPLAAQQPTAIATYRAPAIALVQPSGGGTVAQDRPAVVFRFLPGEPTDPLDVRSFTVAVDGADRTPLFQVSATEAWGPLAVPASESERAAIALGAHQLTARICSTRGVCASVAAMVTVVPRPGTAAIDERAPSGKARLFDAVLSVARKLLTP